MNVKLHGATSLGYDLFARLKTGAPSIPVDTGVHRVDTGIHRPSICAKIGLNWSRKFPQVLLTFHHHHCRDRRCNRLRTLCARHLWNLPGISCKSWHTDPYLPSCIARMPYVVLEDGDNFESESALWNICTSDVNGQQKRLHKFARLVGIMFLRETTVFDS